MLRTQHFWSAAAALAISTMPAFAQTAAPTQPAPTAPARPATAVAATVNGRPIYEGAVQRGLEHVPAERRAAARAELLNFLIDTATVDQYLLLFQLKVENAEVDKKIEEIKAEIKKTQNKDFDKFLADMKLTDAELREHIVADLRWEKFATSQATDKTLTDLFNANKDMFDGSMVRARHILLAPADNPTAAEETVRRLQAIRQEVANTAAAGVARLPANTDPVAREKEQNRLIEEAFAAKAKELSICPSKMAGGDVNWFGRVGVMVEAFSKAAFALKPYQMSDVVKTQFGYHLILVTERKAGRDVKFIDVKDMVKEVYYDKLREAIIAQERPKAKIEIAK